MQILKNAYRTLAIMSMSLFSNATLAQEAMVNDIRSVPAESLAASRNDNNWQPPRTSWGHPDIQGIWTSDDMRGVPTNRPQQFGERTSLTAEEFAQRANRDQAGMDRAVNDETFLRNEYGIRTFGYTSLVIDPPNGRIPEMTDVGKSRAAPRDRGTFGSGPFNTVEDFTNYDRCISRGIVGSVLPVLYGNGMRILQTPDSVVISYEMIHDTRIIPIDESPFLDDAIRQYLGSSRGYWDGDTLVIETRNLTDKTSIGGNGNGTRHSEEMVMTEHMTRVDDEMIDYIITVNDPVTYTAPFSFRFTITSQPGYQLYEYSCHEGNGAVGHTLSGERAWERQVAEAMANGETMPERAGGFSIYAAPQEGAEIIQIGEEDAVD
ncbi:MAG: hypothetical protein HOH14_03600 [Gammaproteobacteria bacterium]|nr:hypothetical protein [Gammaproteobacteria bacterium]MBT6042560.1 hypothetical protein [Gammaproteobacteria bacterium]